MRNEREEEKRKAREWGEKERAREEESTPTHPAPLRLRGFRQLAQSLHLQSRTAAGATEREEERAVSGVRGLTGPRGRGGGVPPAAAPRGPGASVSRSDLERPWVGRRGPGWSQVALRARRELGPDSPAAAAGVATRGPCPGEGAARCHLTCAEGRPEKPWGRGGADGRLRPAPPGLGRRAARARSPQS